MHIFFHAAWHMRAIEAAVLEFLACRGPTLETKSDMTPFLRFDVRLTCFHFFETLLKVETFMPWLLHLTLYATSLADI